MDHVAGVRVGHRLADLLEDLQEPRQVISRSIPARRSSSASVWPFDQLHGEVRPAVAEGAQLVDRHDPRVLQLAADLRLFHEPPDQVGICRV